MKFTIKALLSIALLVNSLTNAVIKDADLTPENLAKTAAQFEPNPVFNTAANERNFFAGRLLQERNAHAATKEQLSAVSQELSTVNQKLSTAEQELSTIKKSRTYRFIAGITAAYAQTYTGAVSVVTGAQDSVLSYKANYTTNTSRTSSALARISASLFHIPLRATTGIASNAQSAWSKISARQEVPSILKNGWSRFFKHTK